MAKRKRISDREISEEVDSYQARMAPLARILKRHQDQATSILKRELDGMMRRGRYDPKDAVYFLNGLADSETIKTIETLIEDIPERERKRHWNRIMDQLVRGRPTRRRAIAEVSRLANLSVLDTMVRTSSLILATVAQDGYYRGTFTLQKSAGIGWAVGPLKDGRTRIIVESIWSADQAKTFMLPNAALSSDRAIYAMLKGSEASRVTEEVDETRKIALSRSKREARTVITDTAQEAHKTAYEEHGVKMYEFNAAWDERTCPVCGSLDGKRFPVSEAKAGVNYPPMHPNCRCTTIAALSKELTEDKTLEYKDDATGQVHKIGYDFHYDEWYRTFGPGRTDGVTYKPKFRKFD